MRTPILEMQGICKRFPGVVALDDVGLAVYMEEVLGVSDRIAVMHEGAITGFLDRADASEEAVMRLAVGKGQASAESTAAAAGK